MKDCIELGVLQSWAISQTELSMDKFFSCVKNHEYPEKNLNRRRALLSVEITCRHLKAVLIRSLWNHLSIMICSKIKLLVNTKNNLCF